LPLQFLIVDDDPAGLLALSEALQVRLQGSIVVDTAPETAAALRYLAVKRYDIALCDVRMPGRDGIALLRQITARWPSVRVIMVTAGEGKEEQALYSGAYAFLHKPIDIDHLLTVVEAAIKSQTPAQPAKNPISRKARLLLVDDDVAAVTALLDAVKLRLGDVDVDTAASGTSALLLMAAHEYDAVLADAFMPGLDGFAMLREARLLRPETPVVLFSGSSEPDIERRAKEGGAYAFLSKGVDREQFFAMVTQAVRRGQLARRAREADRNEFLSSLRDTSLRDTSFAVTGLSVVHRVRELSESLQDKIGELTQPGGETEDPKMDREEKPPDLPFA
jgi:DNA-binding NtrC family response regulator